ncbi:MAG: cob(I)yrinic acid a,c-diamide adenosyltransferase [Planctomycetaceae bacterium]|nr:MAG: cob(I)yrinic acid a,c-diamide adenosyltransferase [Planctomycetaceae bacterium]
MESSSKKIYTGIGDKGETRLLSGEMVGKDDSRVRTYGGLDEFQSHLGLARSLIREESVRNVLVTIQEDIFVASSELASTPEVLNRLKRRLGNEDISRLERRIDEFTALYGIPRHFVMPGKSPDSAALHIARAVCRRCERLIVMLNKATGGHDELAVYFNRLSDLLFVLAWALEINSVVKDVVSDLIEGEARKGNHP